MKRKTIILITAVLAIVILVIALLSRQIGLQSPIVFLDEPHSVVDQNPKQRQDIEFEIYSVKDEPTHIYVVNACEVYVNKNIFTANEPVVVENTTDEIHEIQIGKRAYILPKKEKVMARFSGVGSFDILCDELNTGLGIYIN